MLLWAKLRLWYILETTQTRSPHLSFISTGAHSAIFNTRKCKLCQNFKEFFNLLQYSENEYNFYKKLHRYKIKIKATFKEILYQIYTYLSPWVSLLVYFVFYPLLAASGWNGECICHLSFLCLEYLGKSCPDV